MQSPNQQHYAQGMGGMAPTYSNSSPSMGMGSPMMPQHMGISGGMAPGMVPQQMGMTGAGHHTAHHHVHHHVPSVIPTKHVIMPVKVSSHHVNNTTDVHYDIEITISEYFPDGSKAEHKHRLSQSFTDLKKIHDAVHHGELVKDSSKLHFPSSHIFERKESDKRVAERMSELKVYLDIVFQSPKALTDKTFLDALKCDRDFELHLKHTADYVKMMKKENKKKAKQNSKIHKKAEKEAKKEGKKADKYYKKEEKNKEEQYHKLLKQQVHSDVHGHPVMPGAMPGAMPGTMPGMMPGTMGAAPGTMGAAPGTGMQYGAMPYGH